MVDMVPDLLYRRVWRLGDVNDDGVVDGDDIMEYLRVRQQGGTSYETAAADLTPQQMADALLQPDQ
jgi:hypothetical protein